MKTMAHVSLAGLVLVCLAGCTPAASCHLILDADLPVTYIRGGVPVIMVKLNGQDLRMVLDSGSQGSSITTATYKRLNLADTIDYRGYSAGVAGDVQSNIMVLQDLTFGAVHLKNQVLDVNNALIPQDPHVPPIDGVIGDDVLGSFDIGFDLPDNRVSLYDQQACAGAQTPWAGQYAPVPITRNKETYISTIPYTIDNQDFAAVIDSGSDTNLVAKASLDRLGVHAQAMPAKQKFAIGGIGRQTIAAGVEQFASASIGAESIDNVWILVADTQMSQFNDMLLGEDYLHTHRVFISNSTDTVYLGIPVTAPN